MFTTIARLAPPARRLLGQHAWKAILLSLAIGGAAKAEDTTGIVRVSDTKPGSAAECRERSGGRPVRRALGRASDG